MANTIRQRSQPDLGSSKPLISDEKKTITSKTHPTVYVVFFSLILDLLAFTLILPLLPSILEHYRVNDKDGLYSYLSSSVKSFQELLNVPSRYNSVLFGGCIGSFFSLLQFLVSPIVGGLSDCYGRKPVLLVCMFGIASSYLLWAVSSNFGIFVIARFIGGLSKGNISLSLAIITDVSNKETRGKGMAFVGIAFSLGFIFGPMIGAIFSKFSDKSADNWYVYPAVLALCLILADILFVITCLKETLPKEKRSKKLINSVRTAMEYITIPALFRFDAVNSGNITPPEMKSLKRLGLIYFIYLFIYSGLEYSVTFLMYHNFNFTSIDQAKVFLMSGVIMALLQGSVVRRIPMHLMQKSAVFGLFLIVPAFIIVGLANSVKFLYLGMIFFAISTAFVVSLLSTLTAKYGDSGQKGTVLGIFRSLGALARALGPIVASTAFWMIGSKATYLTGGILLLCPALMLQLLKLS